ncbi:MAG TPA: DNA double-strand break repair nuclease NurA [Nitrososphaeraceae archaeon]|nr:DNA double-strand break repair nuclease NurA [Nitrososphaeraceae archaeon]
MYKVDSPSFLEIPASLIEQMLQKTNEIGDMLQSSIHEINRKRHKFRLQLEQIGLLDTDIRFRNIKPLISGGVDGAYAVDRLLGTDLLFAAAVGVEGMNEENGKRVPPSHDVFVNPEKHNPENMIAARAIMVEMEIQLAANANYDIVYLDGSLTTALIHMYKAINFIETLNTKSSEKIKEDFKNFLVSYKKILEFHDTEKYFLGIPKYTSRNDIGKNLHWPENYDDRAILTLILDPGEFTRPKLFTSEEGWHVRLPYEDEELKILMQQVISGIKNLSVIYYKPHPWCPALRIEMSSAVARDESKLDTILYNVKSQCQTPSIMEPFPLYMADRIAKHMAPAIPAYKQIIMKQMTELADNNEKDIFFMMHSYRTEGGS